MKPEEAYDKWLKATYHRKPTHGPCCTCQTCGQCYDDCRCDCVDMAQTAYLAATERAAGIAVRYCMCVDDVLCHSCEIAQKIRGE